MPRRAATAATPRTDPELRRRLAKAGGAAGPIGAVCRLRPRRATDVALGPDETERTARVVLDRVTRSVGEAPERWNVFRNLGAFVVVASRTYLRELVEQPEIEAATPNRPTGEDLLIRPVKKRPARRATKRKGRAAPRAEKG